MVLFCLENKMAKKYVIKFLTMNGNGPTYSYNYSLPKGCIPGEWNILRTNKRIECCENGFHSTLLEGIEYWHNFYNDMRYKNNIRCFLCDVSGRIDTNQLDEYVVKIASAKIRLCKEIKLPERGFRKSLKTIQDYLKEHNISIYTSKEIEDISYDNRTGYRYL